MLCFNAHDEAIEFTLPSEQFGSRWQLLLDTASGLATVADEATPLAAEATVTVDGRALTVFRTVS
ncbi:glycogen debranching protein GlgX [Mycolicibacterium aubagnense]